MENKNITSVARVERMIAKLKRDNPLVNDWESYKISFEYVAGSLFPTLFKNVQKALKDEYTRGYIAGLEETKNGTQVSH